MPKIGKIYTQHNMLTWLKFNNTIKEKLRKKFNNFTLKKINRKGKNHYEMYQKKWSRS